MSQEGRILRYCEENGSITRLEAMSNLGICNFTARISEMGERYDIDKTWEEGPNRYGENTRYMRYRIRGEKHVSP